VVGPGFDAIDRAYRPKPAPSAPEAPACPACGSRTVRTVPVDLLCCDACGYVGWVKG